MSDNTEMLDFAPNYCHVIELDITPSEETPTWAYALRGITSCVPSNDETKNEDEYYDNLGFSETDITKVKVSLALKGHRRYGDPVQDFVQSLALETGAKRKTRYRWTMPDGTYLEGRCTLTDIVPGSGMGDPTAKGDFGYGIAINSVDTLNLGEKTLLPTSITQSAVSVAAGSTATASPSVTPSGANQRCHFAVEDTSVATVDADGVVTGVAAGSTTLTIKAASKPSVVKQVAVTVTAASGGSGGSGGSGNGTGN